MSAKFLIHPLLVGCLLISACSLRKDPEITVITTELGEKVRNTIRHRWNMNANAIARKIDTGAWEFARLETGKSVVVRLYYLDVLIGAFDGAGYYEIVFQIPSDVRPGQTLPLKPMPKGRKARKEGGDDLVATMKDGEITAFKFGNPMMGWMQQCKIATVEIISIGDKEAVIRLRLKTDLDEAYDFDMDQLFTAKVTPPKRR